jgi:hypothetical protein
MFQMGSLREAYGVFDRIAVLLNHHLSLGIGEKELSFANLFFKSEKRKRIFRQHSYPEAVGLRALLFLSSSFETSEGRFGPLRTLRNSLQHSIVIPTEDDRVEGFGPWATIPVATLEARVFQTLRLCRAAMLYAVGFLGDQQKIALRHLQARGIKVPESRIDVERD